jgi:hypothetical protein
MNLVIGGSSKFSAAWWRRRARRILLILVLALAGLGTLIGTSLPGSIGTSTSSSVPAGLFVGSQNPSDVLALGTQLGVTPSVMTVYADGSCYCTYSTPPSTSMTLMLGVGALTTSEATSIGNSLVAAGQSHAILRIMWEQNQDTSGWFQDWNQLSLSAAQYIATFQSIVTTMRAVPGQAFKFMWNPNGGTGNEASGRTWQDTWPGSTYVNYVGVDQYDFSGYAANIQSVIAFANSQGLASAIPEWGLNGSDDPTYIKTVASIVNNPANNVAVEAYFNYNGGSGGIDSDITQFPQSEAAYTADFGGLPSAAPTTTPPSDTPPSAVTNPSSAPPHVMMVMMENQGYGQIIGNSAMPFTNGLATSYGSDTKSYALGHPSLPNYLAIVSGSNDGVTVDEPPSASGIFGVPTLGSQLTGAGISAKAYAENLPADPTNDSGLYAVRHNPWEYFSNTLPVSNATSLTSDLNSSSAPDFVWYTPNLTNDGHTGVPTDTAANENADAETFLSSFVPSVQATSWYAAGGQIIIEWDEALDADTSGIDGGAGGHDASPQVDTTPVDTVGVLHSIEDTYGLAHLGGSSSDGTIDPLLRSGGTTTTTTTTTSPPSTTTTTSPPSTTTTTSPPSTTTTTSPPSTTTTTTSPPGSEPTVTSVTVAPDATSSMQVFTATVSPAPDSGTVSFSVDGQPSGVAVPVGDDGIAVMYLAAADGPHNVIATYSGSPDFASSSVNTVLWVGQAATSLMVSAPQPVDTGDQYLLSATLTSGDAPIAGAQVSFTAADSPLCQATTDAQGNASCSVDKGVITALSLTTTGYTATFGGDPAHLPASGHSSLFVHRQNGGGHRGDGKWWHSTSSGTAPSSSSDPSHSWPSHDASGTTDWQNEWTTASTRSPISQGTSASAIADTSAVKKPSSVYDEVLMGLLVLLGAVTFGWSRRSRSRARRR